jgi:hypothetical protein
MVNYPRLQFKGKQKTVLTEFRGLNHTPTCEPGEWYEANNVSNIEYPMLTTHGDRAAVTELGGFLVPSRDIIAFCGSEPPAYLDAAGHLMCGGNEVVLATTTEIGWTATCTMILDESNSQAVFVITDAGAAAVAGRLGLIGGSGKATFVCVGDETAYDFDSSRWDVFDSNANKLDSGVKLSDYGITRTDARGPACAGEEAFTVDVQEVVLNALTGPRQMVQMGAWVLIWPDKWFCNAAKLASGLAMVPGEDYGSMELHNEVIGSDNHPVYTMLCHLDGTAYNTSNARPAEVSASGRVYYGKDEPYNPNNTAYAAGDLWLSVNSDYTEIEARVWDTDMGWMPTTDLGVMFWGRGIAAGVKEGYRVTVAGWDGAGANKMIRRRVNGEHPVLGVDPDGNWLILGDCFVTTSGTMKMVAGTVSVSLSIPDMDFVVECNNRLWGCYYGEDAEGNVLNEIYASALGDYRSWRQYEGLATDSWTASRGSPGPFNGAAVLGGNPLFFKADSLEKVFPSATGAHQIQTISLNGVQAGCAKSLVVIDNALYYKSPLGVCVYTGSLPRKIGYKLGQEATEYGLATAGRSGKRYVIDMQGPDARRLFVYDTETGYWQAEDPVYSYLYTDETDVPCLVTYGDELYATRNGALLQLVRNAGYEEGTVLRPIPRPDRPTIRAPKEGAEWNAVTANLGVEHGQRKYVSRIRIRVRLYDLNLFRVYISYDDGKTWELKYNKGNLFVGPAPQEPKTICLYPRRCDRFRLKFEGAGRFELQMIQFNTETGSDV